MDCKFCDSSFSGEKGVQQFKNHIKSDHHEYYHQFKQPKQKRSRKERNKNVITRKNTTSVQIRLRASGSKNQASTSTTSSNVGSSNVGSSNVASSSTLSSFSPRTATPMLVPEIISHATPVVYEGAAFDMQKLRACSTEHLGKPIQDLGPDQYWSQQIRTCTSSLRAYMNDNDRAKFLYDVIFEYMLATNQIAFIVSSNFALQQLQALKLGQDICPPNYQYYSKFATDVLGKIKLPPMLKKSLLHSILQHTIKQLSTNARVMVKKNYQQLIKNQATQAQIELNQVQRRSKELSSVLKECQTDLLRSKKRLDSAKGEERVKARQDWDDAKAKLEEVKKEEQDSQFEVEIASQKATIMGHPTIQSVH
mmetsp:Transcript_3397/g.5010  ORF Transcript_3397/g.5010 Transcript_3397/m.5010 type:complete len:365 (-) Transcript_3397:485-1579(-)